MLKVGLTGGIGAGKSEVSRLLASYGAVLIDADRIAREVVEPGTPGLAAVVDEFGDGRARPRTAASTARSSARSSSPTRTGSRALNAIVHPLVGRPLRASWRPPRRHDAVVVHDVPLLAENGLAPLYDLVVVVDAARDPARPAGAAARHDRGAEARARMAAQATREKRLEIADVVIDNDGPLEVLEPQVRKVWAELWERAAGGRHQN